jgi:uncharacterized repeat protein (TIGR04052 family)
MLRRSILAALVAAAGLAPHVVAAQDQPLSVRFTLMAGDKPVGCGAPLGELGKPAVPASLHDARVYVYGFSLIDAQGKRIPLKLDQNDWQYADVALLDFKDARGGRAPCSENQPAKNAVVTGSVPPGAYTGLAFSVGVPVEAEVGARSVSLNHSNLETAPAPLDIAAMNWSWQAGRKFLLVEVDPAGGLKRADGSPARTWMVHLGSTGCIGNPATGDIVTCARPNRFTVTFDHFDTGKDEVAIDLAALFQHANLTRNEGGAVGCMSDPSDPECAPIFAALGLNLNETHPGAGDAGRPTRPGVSPVFKVRSKP